jgi:hypothetical protein
MYRSCIFCSAALGSNESIERFPVGRSLAFDAAKGRLWAVCPKCARWNLAPIEERWEAVEDAERRFRDTRVRVQSENIGLVKRADGTRLIRVGAALPGEVAAWRYGRTLRRRYTAQMWAGGAAVGVSVAGMVGTGFVLGLPPSLFTTVMVGFGLALQRLGGRRVVLEARLPETSPGGEPLTIRGRDLDDAELVQQDGEPGIRLPRLLKWKEQTRYGGRTHLVERSAPFTVTGPPARMLLGRIMVATNNGGDQFHLNAALRKIETAGSAQAFLRNTAEAGLRLFPSTRSFSEAMDRLALEMALHEDTERRALEGELAMLEAMWRDAEEIAAIADRLPELAAPEPPRLSAEG